MPANAKIKPLKRVIHPIEIDTTALDVVVLDENSAASNAAKVQAEAHWRSFGTPEFYAFDNGPDFRAIRWNQVDLGTLGMEPLSAELESAES